MAKIKIKRGTLAQLDTAAAANDLAAGEPYLVTDSAQLAVGTAVGAYALAARDVDLQALKVRHALGALGSTETIDLANGPVQTGTVDANVTITLPSIPSGKAEHLTLILTNSGGPWAITIASAAGFVWLTGTAPTLDTASAARNMLVFRGADGSGWIGDGGKA